MHTTEILHKGVSLTITYYYTPEEIGTYDTPCHPARVDIENIKIGDIDATDLLDCEIETLEDIILDRE